jgi:hypothetical protein
MPGVVEIPVQTRQFGSSMRSKAGSDAKPSVFDEPLSLVIPRALILLFLWVAWTFAWSGVTYVGLSDNYQFTTGAPLGFFDYWY